MRTRFLRCRPLSGRLLLLLVTVLAFVAYCYYYTTTVPLFQRAAGGGMLPRDVISIKNTAHLFEPQPIAENVVQPQCSVLREAAADIDTAQVYPTFEFQPGWLRSREFWNKTFEDRYERQLTDASRPKLKIIVVPYSHNDPGWVKTFEQYFEWKTKNIINNAVRKLNQYNNMTFIWTEISFLHAWWERSHPIKQKNLKKLVKEGRFEITAGGWVMPDEACTHIYSLIDQFIEGHIWLKNNLGISPKTGWSIDPFGHGPTVPYLLAQSGLEASIIQRAHYAWKQWLAYKQIEEFRWVPGWETSNPTLLIHNQPFDIYSIKSSCGPHPSVCLGYDFRRIPGEYTEYSARYEPITDENVHSKSKTLVEEYARTASLTPHNVALIPLGDDFRYEYSVEFDQQYQNYMKMFNYINGNPEIFNADVKFGTPHDYFVAVKERHKKIPTLKGDMFPYSEIFTEGKPAYWSGFYSTRPYLKLLARQFEHQLRTSEILFTLVLNHLKQLKDPKLASSEKLLEKFYESLVSARRNLGLFQHHDAITGTSKSVVMTDYGIKIFTSLYHCVRLQELALSTLMLPDETLHNRNVLQSELEWEVYGKPVKRLEVAHHDRNKVVLFNSLMESRTEVVTIRSNSTSVRVFDTYRREYVPYQVAPVIESSDDSKYFISETSFDLMFVASLPPLTAVTFDIEEHTNVSNNCIIFCNNCIKGTSGKSPFVVKRMPPGDIQIENAMLKLLVNRHNGFLRQVHRKDAKRKHMLEIQMGAYQSAQRHSGAYLFQPDGDMPEMSVLRPYGWSGADDEALLVVSGPVATDVTALYLPLLAHTLRIFHVDDYALARSIFLESVVNYEQPPKNRETELFMRLQTDIDNGGVFHTDQNGFQYQKRVKVDKLGIEGNYYPITTMAWIQDASSRLTLLTNHAQGSAAFEPGRLEVMLDRRTLYDDFRGVGEGLVDNKMSVFNHWLLLESVEPEGGEADYQLPSDSAHALSRALNYPVNTFLVDSSETPPDVRDAQRLVEFAPPGLHLVTLRTLTDEILDQLPSARALLVLQRAPGSCSVAPRPPRATSFSPRSRFLATVSELAAVSLTGVTHRARLAGLQDIILDPMDVKTFKVAF